MNSVGAILGRVIKTEHNVNVSKKQSLDDATVREEGQAKAAAGIRKLYGIKCARRL